MNMSKLLLVILLGISSTTALAAGGSERSLQMIKKFREGQAELKGKQFFARKDDKAAADKASGDKSAAPQLSAQKDREKD